MKSISRIRKTAAVAAILVLALGVALGLASCGANKPAGGDTNTDGTASTTKKTPDDPAPERKFEVEDGVLVSYRGSDEIVTVPDDVTEIAAGAFEASPNVKGITAVKIGANVKKIADTAFSRMTGLRSFEIAEENENYTVISDVAVNRDGSQCFFAYFTQDGDFIHGRRDGLVDFVERVEDREITLGAGGDLSTRFNIIGAVIDVEVLKNPWYGGYGEYGCVVTGLSFGEYSVSLPADEPACLYGNFYVTAFVTDDYFVFDVPGNVFVFGDGGVSDIYDCFGDYDEDKYYNMPVLLLFKNDDGTIGYTRTPEKFYGCQAVGMEIERCVARDEFCRETGTLTLDGTTPVFTASTVETVSDVFDVDELFREWMQTTEQNYPDADTFLAENAKKYDRAY